MKTKDQEDDTSDFEEELLARQQKEKRKKLKICFFCEKLFDVNSVDDKFRKSNKYRCKECYEANIEKKIKYKDVICNFCGKKFVDTYYTKKGLLETKTRNKKCDDCKSRKIPKGPLPRPKCEYFECDLCGKRCKNKIILYNHMDRHRSDVRCKVCGAKFTARSALRAHLRTHFETYICELCGFTTNNTSRFRIHNNIHAGKLPAVPKVYPRKEQPKGIFTCEDCGIVFTTKVALQSHQKRQHSENGVNGFSCKICGHLSYRIKEYRIHAISHSNKPLLFCHYPNCNIFYDRLKPLNTHIRNVHKQAEASYGCDICGKKFKYKYSVDKHVRNNRCIPLKQRKLGKDLLSKCTKDKSAEELERIAKIAKEQYLEARGSITVIETLQPSENEDEQFEIVQENVDIEENIIGNESEDPDEEEPIKESNIFDDFIDTSQSSLDTEDVQGLKPENVNPDEPLIKIEIKTEPDIDDMLDNPIVQEEWNFLSDDFFRLKNDPEINEIKMKLDETYLSQDPIVLVQRLDDDTITEWTRIKKENLREIGPKSIVGRRTLSKILYSKLAQMRQIAYNRRLKGEPYECDFCGYKSRAKKKMKLHLIQHRKVKEEFNYQCKYCPEWFKRVSHLREHMKRVHKIYCDNSGNKDYICDLCGKGYYTIGLLKTHINVTHYALPIYECSHCSKKFKTKAYLIRHQSDVHDKIFRYPCVYCGKLFKRKYQLKGHELTHSTPMTECKICGKMVKIMKLHLRTVHNKVKKHIELIPCPTCGKGFSKFNLQLHIDRTHLKLVDERTKIRYCPHCSETFTRVDDLRRHEILTHYQGVVKKCPYENCDAIFKKTKPLNLHIKNRHERKDHYCNVCGRKFNTRSGLLKHTKIKGHRLQEEKNDDIDV